MEGSLLGPSLGDDHHGRIRIDAAGVLEHLHAVGVLHRQVGDHHVEAPRLDAPQCLLAALGGVDLVAFLGEHLQCPEIARREPVMGHAVAQHPGAAGVFECLPRAGQVVTKL